MPQAGEPYRLLREDTGAPVVDVLHLAMSIWSRFVGLQFRRTLPPSHGLLIVPCSSIHTMFVRFAIDVAFLSDEGIVTEIRKNMRPWRIAVASRAAHAVLEMAAGNSDLEPGIRLTIDAPADTVPDRLKFLTAGPQAANLEYETC